MPYVLRFVQRFRAADERAFLALEAKFAALERRHRDLPKGRRLRPYAGREPSHTLVWECEFASLEAAQREDLEGRAARAMAVLDPIKLRLKRTFRMFAPAHAGRTLRLVMRIRRRLQAPRPAE